MMKRVSFAALGIATLLSVSAQAQTCPYPVPAKSLIEAGKMQMSINPTLPPQQFVDEKGELKGLNVDITKAIAKKICVEPVYIRMDAAGMVPGLRAGRYDMINTGLFWTKERAETMFMVPYGLQSFTAVATKTSKLELKKPEDMAGLRAGSEVNTYPFVMANRLSKELEDKGSKPITVQGFGNSAEALAALQAGQIDVIITPDTTAKSIEERGGGKVVLPGLWGSQISFAFRDRDLAEAVAKALGDVKKEGVYDKIFDEFKMSRLNRTSFAIRGPEDAAIN